MRKGSRRFAQYGSIIQLQQYPANVQPFTFSDFSGGYNSGDEPEDIARTVSPFAVNTEIDRRGRIKRAPGMSLEEELTGHDPYQMVLHRNLGDRSELLLF